MDEAEVPIGLHGRARSAAVRVTPLSRRRCMSTGPSSARRVGNSVCHSPNSPSEPTMTCSRRPAGRAAARRRPACEYTVTSTWRGQAATRIRGANGATSMRSQQGLPAARGSRPSSARCQPSAGRAGRRGGGGGIAAVIEGNGLLRVRASHQHPQRQGRERQAALHAGLTCSSASTSASTRIGLLT